jgi:glycerol-3-phosphate dehydrogenase (NAD(P)+)
MEIGLIGLGNMGTAIAVLMAGKGHNVLAWEYHASVVKEVNKRHVNTRFLPGVVLPPSIRATADLEQVVGSCDTLCIAIHTIFFREVLVPFSNRLAPGSLVVNLAKGIEEDTCKTPSQVLGEIFPQARVVVLSGPTIANEFSLGCPAAAVIAGESMEDLHRAASFLDTESFRTRFSGDVIGVEWGGVLKNVYAIGLGLMDGVGMESLNFKAAFLTRALREMMTFVNALGGDGKTVCSIAGLGDLLATALSLHSHNRRMGELLGQGLTLEEVEREIGVIPEGYRTLKAVLYLAEKHCIFLPLAGSIWDMITGGVSPESVARDFIRLSV